MKKKTFDNKLSLNKKTITNLTKEEMKEAIGAASTHIICTCFDPSLGTCTLNTACH